MFQILTEQQTIHQNLSLVNYLGIESLQSSLMDRQTCRAYQQAIQQNAHQFVQKTVLHIAVGCNCLYSIFAAQAGAKKVYCVVNGHGEIETKNIHLMKQVIKQNHFEDVISVMFWKDFCYEVDVIVGEPMGYNLIYDGFMDRMIEARDLYMKDVNKGLIFPSRIRYKCAFIRDDKFIQKKICFWDQVYGVPMNAMKNWISHEPIVRTVDPSSIVSQVTKFIDFDLLKTTYQEIDNINKSFTVKTPSLIQANGLAMWFEIQFKKSDGEIIEVKASPWCQSTKWLQMTLYNHNLWNLENNGIKNVCLWGKKNHQEGSVVIGVEIEGEEKEFRFS